MLENELLGEARDGFILWHFSTFSEVRDNGEKRSAPLAILRLINANTAAIPDLVALIEEVHNVRAHLDVVPPGHLRESVLVADVEHVVLRFFLQVRKAAAQPVAIDEIDIGHLVLRGPRSAGCRGELSLMVKLDRVRTDVSQLVSRKLVLCGVDVPLRRFHAGKIPEP